MKRFWKRQDRVFDALVISLAVPAIVIAATMTSQDYSQAKERAAADYKAALARCDSLSGNPKDVCMKEAKAAEVKAEADAKATEKIAAARQDAAEDKRDADYKVALEKCDALAGAAKGSCVANLKTKFGK